MEIKKTKIYCIAFGNGAISAFMEELGPNYYCSSAHRVGELTAALSD